MLLNGGGGGGGADLMVHVPTQARGGGMLLPVICML